MDPELHQFLGGEALIPQRRHFTDEVCADPVDGHRRDILCSQRPAPMTDEGPDHLRLGAVDGERHQIVGGEGRECRTDRSHGLDIVRLHPVDPHLDQVVGVEQVELRTDGRQSANIVDADVVNLEIDQFIGRLEPVSLLGKSAHVGRRDAVNTHRGELVDARPRIIQPGEAIHQLPAYLAHRQRERLTRGWRADAIDCKKIGKAGIGGEGAAAAANQPSGRPAAVEPPGLADDCKPHRTGRTGHLAGAEALELPDRPLIRPHTGVARPQVIDHAEVDDSAVAIGAVALNSPVDRTRFVR